MRSLAALACGILVAAPFAPRIFDFLKRPLRSVVPDPDTFVRVFEVTGAMSVAMTTALWTGVLLSAPFIVFFAGRFVFPGLTRAERRAVFRSSGFALALFAGGVALAWTFLPQALRVMLWFNTWMHMPVEFFRAGDYVRFVLVLLLSFGITFELPLLLIVLGHLGIVTSAQLRTHRRHAFVVILVLAAFVTPTTDPFSQLAMAIPLALLFELCIAVIRAKERRREQEAATAA